MTNIKPTSIKKELRDFGLLTGFLVLVLFGGLLPWLLDQSYMAWPWVVAVILWLWAIILPTSLSPIYKIWMTIGHILGWINTRIILGILFYFAFLPMGLIMRCMGKDPMCRRFSNTNSYRQPVEAVDKEHMERPY